jgi:hypothetical protein
MSTELATNQEVRYGVQQPSSWLTRTLTMNVRSLQLMRKPEHSLMRSLAAPAHCPHQLRLPEHDGKSRSKKRRQSLGRKLFIEET